MRIAYITSRYPYPVTSGGRMRAHRLLHHLVRSHEVTLYAIVPPSGPSQGLEEAEPAGLKKKLFRISSAGYGWNAVRGLFSSMPFQVKLYQCGNLLKTLAADVEKGEFDVLIAQLLRAAEYTLPFPHLPRIIDLVDSYCLHYRRMQPIWHSPTWLMARADRERVCKYESQVPSRFDSVLISSRVDLDWVRARSGANNIILVPNGVEMRAGPGVNGQPEPNTICLFGRLDYLPNTDAAVYFAKQIFPLVRKSVPDARFRIIGWNPPPVVRALGRISGITIHPNVPEIRPEIVKCAVSVCPLRFGAGTQYKILESLALGVPVVATPEPAQAILDNSGEGILVGRNPEEFARQVARLLNDNMYRQQLGQAGRSLVESRYTWDRVFAPLDTVLQEIERRTRTRAAGSQVRELA